MKLPVDLRRHSRRHARRLAKRPSEVAQYLGLALEDYVAIEDTLPSDRFREAFAAIKPKLQKIGITVGDPPEWAVRHRAAGPARGEARAAALPRFVFAACVWFWDRGKHEALAIPGMPRPAPAEAQDSFFALAGSRGAVAAHGCGAGNHWRQVVSMGGLAKAPTIFSALSN
jgi:hypothetical protein